MNKIDKVDRISDLFDQYSALLTDKQQEMIQMYYLDDLSLGEIAEEMKITRAAAADLIKRTEKLLEKYESKLWLVRDSLERKSIYLALSSHPDEQVRNLMEELIRIEDKKGGI